MEKIIQISGNSRFTITLDPSVWIFDDRKVDLTSYFEEDHMKEDELETYTKNVSKHWDREIIEGATYPPTLKTEKKYEREKWLTGSYGIPFEPFLKNAEPTESANTLLIVASDRQVEVPLETAYQLILGFSENGKPLTTDGPVHVYYGDGSNKNNPIKNVTDLILK